MAYGGIGLALLALAASQAKELVALPLSESGVKPPAGLDAWKIVTLELKRGSTRLGMSVALQKKRHDFLIGPAREQARDCGENLECLSEIGAALGADVLIAGTVDGSGVALVAIDVKTGKRIGSARSSKRLASTPIKRQATVTARALVETLAKTSGAPPAAAKPGEDLIDQPVVESEPAPAPVNPAGPTEVAQEPPPSATEEIAEPVLEPPPPVEPAPPPVRPPEPAEVAAATARPPPRKDDVFTTWWFWTSIGVAVAAGATTAAVLAAGAKGGPDLERDTGTIRGRY